MGRSSGLKFVLMRWDHAAGRPIAMLLSAFLHLPPGLLAQKLMARTSQPSFSFVNRGFEDVAYKKQPISSFLVEYCEIGSEFV